MNRLLALCAAAALALSLTACNQATAPAASTHDADVKAIQDVEAQWLAAWQAKDTAKIASRYADDAVWMTPGSGPTTGKDAIAKMLTAITADPAIAIDFHQTKIDAASAGDVAWSEGAYTMTRTDPQSKQVVHEHGSYLTVYRKQADGSWKAVSDAAVSGMPQTPPTPAKPMKKSM